MKSNKIKNIIQIALLITLFIACSNEDMLIPKQDVINNIAKSGKSILHYAAEERSADIKYFKKLIRNGADVNVQDTNGSTPLHIAVLDQPTRYGDFKTIKYLVKKGADINIQDKMKNTPLHILVMNKQKEYHEDYDVVTYLLKKGADVHSQNILGNTPVHCLLYKIKNTDYKKTKMIISTYDGKMKHVGVNNISNEIKLFKVLTKNGISDNPNYLGTTIKDLVDLVNNKRIEDRFNSKLKN